MTHEGAGEGSSAVSRVGRLFEAFGVGEGVHAIGERVEQQRRFGGETAHEALDDVAVLDVGHLARTRAEAHAQLGGCARRRSRLAGRLGCTPADRHRGLDGLGQEAGGARRWQRAQIQRSVAVAHLADDREPGETLVEGQLEIGVAPPGLRPPVERRHVLVDEPHLEHRRLQRPRADDVVDGLHLPEQLRDLAPLLGGEVGAHAGPQVGGLAHVEHAAAAAAEEVDAGEPGESTGQAQLVELGTALQGGQLQEVVEAEDAEAAGPLEQHVQQVARGESVIEGTVGGAMAEAQARRQRSQDAFPQPG